MFRIKECTSEHPDYPSRNVMTSTPWKTLERTRKATLTLSTDSPIYLSSISFVNTGTMYIEIRGVVDPTSATPPIVILPQKLLIPFEEFKKSSNTPKQYLFGDTVLSAPAHRTAFLAIQIVISSPVSAAKPYGISQLQLGTSDSPYLLARLPLASPFPFSIPDASDIFSRFEPVAVTNLLSSFKTPLADLGRGPDKEESQPHQAARPAVSATERYNKLKLAQKKPISSPQSSQSDSQPSHSLLSQPSPTPPARSPPSSTPPAQPLKTQPVKTQSLASYPKLPQSIQKQKRDEPTSIINPNTTSAILKGVKFALSGFINPQRGELRDIGLELGAEYLPNVTPDCTHLVCAFLKSDKIKEAQKVNAVCVKESWLRACKSKNRHENEDHYKI
ncbi:putative DNA repair protein XRCC1 [Blattamonas nauphoetae]|uniref:DNA repair protein XRCC1 n=1 Tax=Blattamonas nauphoetae TaxID=2049346 RepID=A0ABQ9Y423_9EUKA|nr:putative DNA repair protein XRCC1 [Blattamonas nauphoetae]